MFFDDLSVSSDPPLIVQENHYDPWGVNLAGIETLGNPDHKWQYLDREKQERTNWYDLQARYYDPVIGRFTSVDPKPDTEGQESLSAYQYGWNNPVVKSDPDGECPNCITGAIGGLVGGLVGGAIEAGSQLIQHGSVNDWKAVGGSAVQFGTAAHSEFKRLVEAKGIKNVRTEVSYLNKQQVGYGTKGSSRADAVLLNRNGTVRQVFDLKTGGATLSPTQSSKYISNVPGVSSPNQITTLR